MIVVRHRQVNQGEDSEDLDSERILLENEFHILERDNKKKTRHGPENDGHLHADSRVARRKFM